MNGHGDALTMSPKDKWMGILKDLVKFFSLFFYNRAPLIDFCNWLFKQVI
ncbi:MAG: hypothetical protein IKS93_02695 [Methanobrevibacter sp.]|nr:hypothetical protein [Methanobrevibacter sp.]